MIDGQPHRKIIQKSVAVLAFKVIILELVIELIYAAVDTILYSALGEGQSRSLQLWSMLLQILFIPLQITALLVILLRWTSETYEFEGQEVIVRQGIVNKIERSYPYNNMQSVEVRQTIFDRILGAGSVSVYIPTLGKELLFTEVSKPSAFAVMLKSAIPYSNKGQFLIQR